mgnify:CR=1 FL=1
MCSSLNSIKNSTLQEFVYTTTVLKVVTILNTWGIIHTILRNPYYQIV